MARHEDEKSILASLAEVEEKMARARTLTDEAAAEEKAAMRRVTEGEKTGDPLQDLLIARYGRAFSFYEPRYRHTQEQVKANKREFILLVGKREEVGGSDIMHPRPHDYVLNTALALGVLEDNKLVIDPTADSSDRVARPLLSGLDFYNFGAGVCEFPTNSFALYEGSYSDGVRRIDGNLPCDLTQLDEELAVRNRSHIPSGESSVKKLEVVIGKSAVYEWIRKSQGRTSTFNLMAEAINRPINGQMKL